MEAPIKTIPLNDLHAALGGKMVPFAGYMMPVRYSSDMEEHLCVRQGVGIFDVSHMGEFFVEGPQALALIQKVTSNDASTLVIGQAQYSCLPNATGGIVDDLIVYKMAEEKYMLVVNASNIDKDWAWIQVTIPWVLRSPMLRTSTASLQCKDLRLLLPCNPLLQ